MKKPPRSTSSDNWWTPRNLVKGLADIYADGQFVLDVAACKTSTVAPHYYDAKRNGLRQDWHRDATRFGGGTAWMNCPYSNKEPWLAKARETAAAGTPVVALLPCSVDTDWFQDLLLPHVSELLLINGRVPHHAATFAGKPKAGYFGSVVAVFTPELTHTLPALGVINNDGTGYALRTPRPVCHARRVA